MSEASLSMKKQQHLRPLNLPALMKQPLSYTQTKWTDIRQDKVEIMRDRFNDPSKILILKDNKFEKNHLAIIRKSVLEDLIKLNADLRSGEAVIKESVEGIVTAVNTLIAVLEEKHLSENNHLVATALQSVRVQIRAVVKTSILFTSEPEDKPSVPLSAEEQSKFADLISGEED